MTELTIYCDPQVIGLAWRWGEGDDIASGEVGPELTSHEESVAALHDTAAGLASLGYEVDLDPTGKALTVRVPEGRVRGIRIVTGVTLP